MPSPTLQLNHTRHTLKQLALCFLGIVGSTLTCMAETDYDETWQVVSNLLDPDIAITPAVVKTAATEALASAAFAHGVSLFESGSYAAASAEFTTALKYRPDQSEARDWLQKAQAAAGSGNAGSNGVPVVAAAPVKEAPETTALHEAFDDMEKKNYKAAITNLNFVIERNPTIITAWEMLGWAYWFEGRQDETFRLWKRLEQLSPGEPRVYSALGKAYIALGNVPDAGKNLAKSLALDPRPETRYAYAMTKYWQGHGDEAIPLFLSVLKGDIPRQIDPKVLRIRLANAYQQAQQSEKALQVWEELRVQYPDSADVLIGSARARLGIGDTTGAKACAEELLSRDEKKSDALIVLAQIAEHNSDPVQGIKQLRETIGRMEDKDKDLKSIRYTRLLQLEVLTAAQRPGSVQDKDILEDAKHAVKLDTNNVPFRLYLAEAYVKNRMNSAAMTEFQYVLDNLNPYNRHAFRGMYQAKMELEQYDEALALLKKSIAYNMQTPLLHYYLAQLALEQGDYAAAHQEIDRFEREGARGAVFVLCYHGLSPTEYSDNLPVRVFRDHMISLKNAGFRFLTPDEITEYFANQPEPPVDVQLSPLDRYWRYIKNLVRTDPFSHKKVSLEPPGALDNYQPPKLVCVTFDDGRRSSYVYGTPVAEELDIRLAMCIAVGLIGTYDTTIASWDEDRKYNSTGRWVMGSHLLNAHIPLAVDKEGLEKRTPVSSRVWLPEKNRQESQAEYHDRLAREFQQSRSDIKRELGLKSNECGFIAYPFGDVGQNYASNVRDVIPNVLMEADQAYRIGFVQDEYGYALKGDNPLLYKRHTPPDEETGPDVLNAAYKEHPVFLARSLRAKVAAQQGRPHLAAHMLDIMKRDGCADKLLDDTRKYVEAHMATRLGSLTTDQQTALEKSPWKVSLEQPTVGVGVRLDKDNQESQEQEVFFHGGIDVTPKIELGVQLGMGTYKHVVNTSTNWSTFGSMTTSNQLVTGVNSNRTIVTTKSTTIPTNALITTEFSTDIQTLGGTINYRLDSGAIFSGHIFQHTYTSSTAPTNSFGEPLTNKINATSFLGFDVSLSGRPTMVTEGTARFTRDAIPALGGAIPYNSLSFDGLWNIIDYWELYGETSFQDISDGNSLLTIKLKNLWLLSQEQQVYGGVSGELINAGHKTEEYWSPSWLERIMFITEIRRNYQNTGFKLSVSYGINRQAAWPEDENRYLNNAAQDLPLGYYPGPDPEKKWAPIIGTELSLDHRFGKHWQVSLFGSVNETEDYSEYNVHTELVYHF